MPWDPDQYLRFADHRTRPGIELLARIPDVDARRVVDLGCGTGNLTALLGRRWSDAVERQLHAPYLAPQSVIGYCLRGAVARGSGARTTEVDSLSTVPPTTRSACP